MLGMFGRRNGDLVPAGGVVGVQVGRGSSRPQALSTPGLQGPEDWDRRLSHVCAQNHYASHGLPRGLHLAVEAQLSPMEVLGGL